jgi:drug/metabolite transporter (DMT)-like permease
MTRLSLSFLTDATRGTLFALLSTTCIALIFVISKWALTSLPPITVGTGVYATAWLIAIGYQRTRRRPGLWRSFQASQRWAVVVLGLTSGING